MLVIISDLHLTDGTTARNVHGSAFELLSDEIQSAIRKKGDIRELRLVLLGDVFDLVRTDYWIRQGIGDADRPWGGTIDPRTGMNSRSEKIGGQFAEILEDVLREPSTVAFLETVNDLLARAETASLSTRLTYVVGNHDRVLWNFQSLRESVRRRFPAVTHNGAFPDRFEFLTVLHAPEYGVIARHGHEWDDTCHGWKFLNSVLRPGAGVGRFDQDAYTVMAIGEVITAELMSGLIARAQREPELAPVIDRLMDLNNVRPLIRAVEWMRWFVRGPYSEEQRAALLRCAKEATRGVIESSFAREWKKLSRSFWIFRGDAVDRLEQFLGAIGGLDFEEVGTIVRIVEWCANLLGGKRDDFMEGAREEWTWPGHEGIQYVLYGHTHLAKNCYFSAGLDGRVRMYINTGTYLPYVRQVEGGGFAAAHQMTLASFYRDDEDKDSRSGPGPTLDLWNGIRRKPYSR